jgi:signal transduction histidine kinase
MEKALKHVQPMKSACLNQTELFNDILRIGTVKAGKLDFKPSPMDLVESCSDLVDEMQRSDSHSSIK